MQAYGSIRSSQAGPKEKSYYRYSVGYMPWIQTLKPSSFLVFVQVPKLTFSLAFFVSHIYLKRPDQNLKQNYFIISNSSSTCEKVPSGQQQETSISYQSDTGTICKWLLDLLHSPATNTTVTHWVAARFCYGTVTVAGNQQFNFQPW